MKPIIKLLVVAVLCLLPLSAFAQNDPKADSRAMVVVGNARFTVLTPELIRMEWSEDGVFEDRATFTFVNRKLSVPEFKVAERRNRVTITTEKVKLVYDKF